MPLHIEGAGFRIALRVTSACLPSGAEEVDAKAWGRFAAHLGGKGEVGKPFASSALKHGIVFTHTNT